MKECPGINPFTQQPRMWADTYLFAHNPLGARIEMTRADFEVVWDGDPELGYAPGFFASANVANMTLVIPPGRAITYKARACITDDFGFFGLLLQYLQDTIGVDQTACTPFPMGLSVKGVAIANIGDFKGAVINYEQRGVRALGRLLGVGINPDCDPDIHGR